MYQEFYDQMQKAIDNYSSDDLKELLNNDDKMDAQVDVTLAPLESQKSYLLSENRRKAEENISKEPKLIENRSLVTELLEEGKTRCSSIQEKLTEIKTKSSNTSPDTALALLQTAAAESEEESEKLVKDFVANDLSVEAFLERFSAIRKTMHLRKFKAEKMTELRLEQQQQPHQGNRNLPYHNNFASSGFYPPPTHFTPGAIGSAPYPLGPIAMPGHPRPY